MIRKRQQGFGSKLLERLLNPKRIWDSFAFRIGKFLYPRYKRPVVILFRYTKALGDNLMLTTVAREVRKRNPNAIIHVITGLPEIFERNPDVDFVSPEPDRPIPGLGRYLIRYEHRFPWKKHFLHYCVECVDIKGHIELRTYIYPSEADREWAKSIIQRLDGQRPILVNRIAGPRNRDKKNWPTEYWIELIRKLLEQWPVVDIGKSMDATLDFQSPNWLDLRGQTTIHQMAALMEQSLLLIGPDSGPLHLAPACGLPALVILGGSFPPVAIQYPGCRVLVSRPPCCDCYEQGPCLFDFRCLWDITPEMVFEQAVRMIEKRTLSDYADKSPLHHK